MGLANENNKKKFKIMKIDKFLTLLTVILNINSCNTQINNKLSENIMKTFDIKTFEKNKNLKNGVNTFTYESKGDIISLKESEKDYVAIKSKKDENFIEKYFYRKSNYTLRASQVFLLEMPVGTYKEYDENGEIINEINYEPKYPFTVLNLIEKVKNKFDIDITKKKQKLIIGFEDDIVPYYFVRFPLDDGLNTYKFIKVNANTGEIISVNITHDIE